MKHAVVLFSGGQDSTTCLIQAIHQYEKVHCITFDYGQRHRAEINAAKKIAFHLGVYTHKILDLMLLNELTVSSLTCNDITITHCKTDKKIIPNTFVPGRNILLLTLAAIYAYKIKVGVVITGVCETDFSGYPDCKDKFVKTLNRAVNLGMDKEIHFETPLMWLNKSQIWALADYWGELNLVCQETVTCYNGIKGSGCSHCAACHLRNNGLNFYLENKSKCIISMKEKINLK